MNSELYPWQQPQWESVHARVANQRLTHAMLLSGPGGLGKLDFARRLARALLCESPQANAMPCGGCRACLLLEAGTHPDLIEVTPEEDARAIKVDQIRTLAAQMTLTRQYADYKVAIIQPADLMNRAAANSLLKTLEEPPAGALMLLVSARPGELPATIRSRCQLLRFAAPEPDTVAEWLQACIEPGQDARLLLGLASGAPLAALHLATSGELEHRARLWEDLQGVAVGACEPVATAAAWLKLGLEVPLNWVHGWAVDMIRLRMSPSGSHLNNPDLRPALQALAERVDLRRLYGLLDRAGQGLGLAQTTVNQQLLLEEMLVYWFDAVDTQSS
ncbi:MAG: DNA polymerase III subunit delta' [Pseudomonadota bacterium]|nr:MAG: DNA polymerase III subunit delta' [Pseudomonadota bacterium]